MHSLFASTMNEVHRRVSNTFWQQVVNKARSAFFTGHDKGNFTTTVFDLGVG